MSTSEPSINITFPVGHQYVVVDATWDLKGSFGCLDKACKFALQGELVYKCQLIPLELMKNKYETEIIHHNQEVS